MCILSSSSPSRLIAWMIRIASHPGREARENRESGLSSPSPPRLVAWMIRIASHPIRAVGHTTLTRAAYLQPVSDKRIKTLGDHMSKHVTDDPKTDHPCRKPLKSKSKDPSLTFRAMRKAASCVPEFLRSFISRRIFFGFFDLRCPRSVSTPLAGD